MADVYQTWWYAGDIGEEGSGSASLPSRLTTEWSSTGATCIDGSEFSRRRSLELTMEPGKGDALDSLVDPGTNEKAPLAISKIKANVINSGPGRRVHSTDFKCIKLFMNVLLSVYSACHAEPE